MRRRGVPRSVMTLVGGGLLMGLLQVSEAAFGRTTLSPSDAAPDTQIVVEIQARRFEPATVRLRANQKLTLVFQNHDAELHAFVPVGLFTGVNVTIGGNGAPDFGPDGLRRVIIPSSGRVEIRFLPKTLGVYPFFCDMPGHEAMRGTLVVE